MGGFFNALRLSKKPSLTHTPLYLILPTVREVIFLLLPVLEFLIDLKALEGFLATSELNVRFELICIVFIRALDNLLLCLQRLLINFGEALVDLQIFRFFLIWANCGHFGGLGGGGGREIDLLVAVA